MSAVPADAPVDQAAVARGLVAVSAACLAVAGAAHFVRADVGSVNAAKVVSAALTVLVVPGLLVVLLARLRRSVTLLEISAMGAVVSIGIVTLLTIASMFAHSAFAAAAAVLVGVVVGLVAAAWRRGRNGDLTTVVAVPAEWWLLGGIAAMSVLLYLTGSPLSPGEDQMHVAVARRLAALSHPSIFNVYMTPDMVYTYPFPTTHGIFALTTLIGGVDVLFVYHKLRFLWAVLAVVSVFVAARTLFGDVRIAAVCGWTGIVLIANGVFGHVPRLMWAQLAPFSHASDVAMGVLLPLLVVITLNYLDAEHRRDTVLFGAATVLMAMAVTTAHIKEIIQFLIYLASFLTVALVLRVGRVLVVRTAVLLAAVFAVVGAYTVFHRLTVLHVDAIVQVNQAHIVDMWRHLTMTQRLFPPLNDGHIVNNFNLLFYELNPVALLAMPIVCAAFVRRRLLPFVWAGTAAYCLIIAVPILSFGYLLSTYFDMLSVPSRYLMFFIYLTTGALVYLAAHLASRLKPLVLGLALLAGLAWVLPRTLDPLQAFLIDRPDVMFAGVVAGLPMAAWWGTTRWGRAFGAGCTAPVAAPRLVACAAVLISGLGASLWQPASALTVWTTPIVHSLQDAIAEATTPPIDVQYEVFSTGKVLKGPGTTDAPTPDLVIWATRNIPVDSVVAANLANGNILTTFIPQRVPAWPLAFQDPINYCINFARYCKAADAAVTKYGVQPFFNDREDRAERVSFLRAFNITHVIIDPASSGMMTPVLQRYPDLFTEVYSDRQWRVFAVHLGSGE